MSDNPLKLKSIHHVELWVGNAKQAAYFYRQAFGFSQIAYAGLETGQRDHTSYALSQGKARVMVSSPLDSTGPIAAHIAAHGDAVRDIAFHVEDADRAFEEAVRRGARPAVEPYDRAEPCGAVRQAAIHTYGDTIHSLLSYKDYRRPFLPGFSPPEVPRDPARIPRADHLVSNLQLGN